MTYEAFLDCLDHPRRTSRGHVATCPAHPDRSPSLSVSEAPDGRILLHDFAGCSTEEILESLGLSMADLFPGKQTREVRNYHRAIKTSSRQIKQAEGFRMDIYRNADKVIAAATGIDISGWTHEELDQSWVALAEAYEILREEKRNECQPCGN